LTAPRERLRLLLPEHQDKKSSPPQRNER